MNIIIFAGGAGTRLWPLSRRNSPKQFAKLRGEQSTLQLAVERVRSFGLEHVYISTNADYVSIVREQVPDIPSENILSEPARRDLAAAVGLTLMRMKSRGVTGTVAVIWSDHFMEHPDRFQDALRQGEVLLQEQSDRLVFLGEEPRWPNHNLGWIHTGSLVGDNRYEFLGWKYRPELPLCEKMFASGTWMWNPGYFIFDLDFMLTLYQKFLPEMMSAFVAMGDDDTTIAAQYASLPSLHFDNAIIEKVDPHQAVVMKVNLGWSDPGTLYALKEALEPDKEKNYEKGRVMTYESKDCLVYNEETGKLVTTIGLDGMVVVNTPDALLVCPKNRVPDVKALLKKMEENNLENYL